LRTGGGVPPGRRASTVVSRSSLASPLFVKKPQDERPVMVGVGRETSTVRTNQHLAARVGATKEVALRRSARSSWRRHAGRVFQEVDKPHSGRERHICSQMVGTPAIASTVQMRPRPSAPTCRRRRMVSNEPYSISASRDADVVVTTPIHEYRGRA